MTTNAQAALNAAAFSASRGGTPQIILSRAEIFLGWLNKNSPTGIKLPGASEGMAVSEVSAVRPRRVPLSMEEQHEQKERELNLRATMIIATLQASGAIVGEPQPVDWANAFKLAKKQSDELAGDEWPPPVAPDEDAFEKPRRKAKK